MRGAAALLALCCLAGAASAEPVPIKLWHSYTHAERDGLEAALGAFAKKHPEIAVESSYVPYDAVTDKLTAAIPRGHGPDVFIFAHNRVGGWAEGGLVAPIELYVDEALLDRHLYACVMALAYKGSLYGLPLAQKTLALYVRTDRVKEPPKTFQELLAAAKANTDVKARRYGLVYPNADFFFHTPLVYSFGGTVYPSETDQKPNVVNPGMEKALAMAKRLAGDEGVLPDDPSPVLAASMFSEGRTPLVISGPWLRAEIDRGVPYTVTPIPAFEGGVASSGFSTCEGVIMSGKSPHKKEAFSLMEFLSSEVEGARPRMAIGGQTVTLESIWPEVLPTLPEGERAIFMAFDQAFRQSVPSPIWPSMNAVWVPMNAALYKTLHQGLSPNEALIEAQKRIDKGLGGGG
ncbi:MAG: extracellular solute-binding protein [Myxococcota bacterium]